MKKLILSFVACVHACFSFAQLTIDQNTTVEELVQDVLLGPGVTATNITFNGFPANIVSLRTGAFNSENANVGIDRGMIVATGDAAFAAGPNNDGGATMIAEQDLWNGNDPDLQVLTNGLQVNDWAIIEFDFVPSGDSLQFSYVWSSEEYMEFVNLGYNDVFGFFVSGPGLNGPFSNNAVNLAMIPGTNTPVTVDNVNEWVNPQYYVHNGDGYTAPWMNSQDYIQLDGLTVPLRAHCAVACGATYHIKIAICDAGDTGVDSAVFIEAESFQSGLPVELDLVTGHTGPENTIYEGCGSAELVIARSPEDEQLDPLDIALTVSGTATSGLDYATLPLVVHIPGAQTEVVVPIEVFADALPEGTETLIIGLETTGNCNGGDHFIEIQILDQPGPIEVLVQGATMCPGGEVTLDAQVFGAVSDVSFLWNTGATTQQITVSPTVPTVYTVNVTQLCSNDTVAAQALVDVLIGEVLGVTLPVGPIVIGCEEATLIGATTTGGNAPLQWEWHNGQGEFLPSETNQLDYDAGTWGAGMVIVEVTDQCGQTASDSVEVVIQAAPVFVDLGADITAACNEVIVLQPQAVGGSGWYAFEWRVDGVIVSNDTQLTINQPQDMVVEVRVTDACGMTDTDEITITVVTVPLQLTASPDTAICPGAAVTLEGTITGGNAPFTWEWTGSSAATPAIEVTPATTTTYTVTATDACGQEASETITVAVHAIEAGILAEEVSADHFRLTALVEPADPNHVLTYLWEFPDGSTSDLPVIDHLPQGSQTEVVVLTVTNSTGCSASATWTYRPQLVVYIPNAFTANADGINEFFRAEGGPFRTYELSVYDRWGNLVFFTEDPADGWNGAVRSGDHFAQDGIFIYYLRATGYHGEAVEKRGHIQLLR